MKKVIYSGLVCLCLSIGKIDAQSLHAYMRNCAFLSMKSDTAYVETYISIPGYEVAYIKNASGKFEGALEVTLLYLRDTSVYTFDKYILRTPEISDTSAITFNILDLRRVSATDGEYTVQLKVKDANNPSAFSQVTQGLKVAFDRSKVSVSDIELVQSYAPTTSKNLFAKNGYDIKPLAGNFYPTSLNRLTFYTEIYNSNKIVNEEDIVFLYSVKHAQKQEVAGNLYRFTKQKAAPVNVLFSEFDITDLPTGNYMLHVEVKNKQNELLSEQTAFFQRWNKNSVTELNSIALIDIANKFVQHIPGDSMSYYLSSVIPAAESYETDYIQRALQANDTLLMKQFFYNFWQKRNEMDPEAEWLTYKLLVDIANYHYHTSIDHGFETDRGRVFLQYGPPNSIEGNTREPGAYPYEIWHYYKLTNNQSNVKFVFCNPDLITNDYKLIHSEARGEIYDARWKFKIYSTFKDNNGNSNFDQEDFRDTFGSQVDMLYNR